MHLLSAVCILGLSAIVNADGGYSGSCKNPIMFDSSLNIQCAGSDDKGSFWETSVLDLNKCYATIADASIVPRINGNFMKRCGYCDVDSGGELSCFCFDGDDNRSLQKADLNVAIRNSNGLIHCDVEEGGVTSTSLQKEYND
ncbi:Cyanovirin-N [Aspergillus affinis]|uniref:Cyanovirin-N n=1 Tax=Aspergillus affinis TaxID=1070780 RepID=UPI0022FDE111|nr:Cyanovirin-N [Aspergillus affinis]KAI9034753.1 Cyanovirin-N [Aspergillus affinis]